MRPVSKIGEWSALDVVAGRTLTQNPGQAAIIALFRVINRYVGNLPPMPGVFLDYPAPVVRNAGTEREMMLISRHEVRHSSETGPIQLVV
jgi:hypothetical protein